MGAAPSGKPQELGCDWHTVNNEVNRWGQALLEADRNRIRRVEALGLDETLFYRTGRYRRRVWAASVVDVAGGQLLDVVLGRNAHSAARWLRAQPAGGGVRRLRRGEAAGGYQRAVSAAGCGLAWVRRGRGAADCRPQRRPPRRVKHGFRRRGLARRLGRRGGRCANPRPRGGVTNVRILRAGLARPDGGSPKRLVHQTLQTQPARPGAPPASEADSTKPHPAGTSTAGRSLLDSRREVFLNPVSVAVEAGVLFMSYISKARQHFTVDRFLIFKDCQRVKFHFPFFELM